MASINSYYTYDHSLSPYYAVHMRVDQHLADTFFNGDLTRIVTASNNYALRKRSDQNKTDSSLNLPFLNYKRTDWDFDDGIGKWSNPAFGQGIHIDGIPFKIKILPTVLKFQSIIWFATENDIVNAYKNLRFDSDGLTELDYSLTFGNVTVPMWLWFTYDDATFDPEYNESDWLEKNKIKTISLNFTVHFFNIDFDESEEVAITEKVLFDFASKKFEHVEELENYFKDIV